MLAQGRYPVARCWTRIYASFTGQIAAVVELEWCECGLCGGRLLGASIFVERSTPKIGVGTQAPCSHRSSSQTRANSPTRIGDPSERDLQARYTGRFCVFQNVDTAPKSSQSVGHACRRSDFCGPLDSSHDFIPLYPGRKRPKNRESVWGDVGKHFEVLWSTLAHTIG